MDILEKVVYESMAELHPRVYARLAISGFRSDIFSISNFSSLLADRRRSRLCSLFSATGRQGVSERAHDVTIDC
jgi:hypothetical protein